MNWSAFLWTALWIVVGLIVLGGVAWIIIATYVVKTHKKVMNRVFDDFDKNHDFKKDNFPHFPGSGLR